MSLEAAFARHLATLELPAGPALVAVSGGPDSLALLHLLLRIRERHALSLSVAHVDHGIHAESAAVAARVAELAGVLELPFEIGRLGLGTGASETAAREARYRWLFAALDRARAGILLTAHHRDDQVETVLMRFLRGSGPAGLAGMAPVRGRLVRPLLPFARQQLHAYLAERGVKGWEDPANLWPGHLRSWLRGTLLPLIRARLPDVEQRIVSVAGQASADREGWDVLLDVLPLDVRQERHGVSVASAVLRGYHSSLSLALVRALGRRVGLRLGMARAQGVLRLVERARSGRVVELGGGWTASLAFDRLELAPARVAAVPDLVDLGGVSGLARVGDWVLRWRPDRAPGRIERHAATSWFLPGAYRARTWRPGDRIRPVGGRGRRLVVRCMQDRKVGSRERPGWPVVTHDDAVIWVPGVSRAADLVPAEGMEALRIDAERA